MIPEGLDIETYTEAVGDLAKSMEALCDWLEREEPSSVTTSAMGERVLPETLEEAVTWSREWVDELDQLSPKAPKRRLLLNTLRSLLCAFMVDMLTPASLGALASHARFDPKVRHWLRFLNRCLELQEAR